MAHKENGAMNAYDVVIIGAGISGLNAAYRIQSECPQHSYTILDVRNSIGGTWNVYQYPGIRSDTDLHTYGFTWSPWTEKRGIADGASITRYMKDTISKEGIDRHIQFGRRVVSAEWSTESQMWSLVIDSQEGRRTRLDAKFLIMGTGYFSHEEPRKVRIPGLLENFKGQIIHPQFWPQDLDYSNKKITIIGSGATAITLLPSLAEKARHVTMLQRSPTYILSIPNITGTSWIHKMLPEGLSFQLSRFWFLIWPIAFYYYCRAFPNRSRTMLQNQMAAQLPSTTPVDPHFKPSYDPWDQRLCFSPDGDFFKSLQDGKAEIITGHIQTCTADGIVLESGQKIDADIIITATGFKMGMGQNIELRVDGTRIDIGERYAWRTTLLQDVPNFAFIIGYINVSWTLGADVSARLICRLLKYMRQNNMTSAVPTIPDPASIRPRPIWNLKATYVEEGDARMPKCGDTGPWKGRSIYFLDLLRAKYGNLRSGLRFYRGTKTA